MKYQLGGNIQNIKGFDFDSNLVKLSNPYLGIYIAKNILTGEEQEVIRKSDGTYTFFTTPSGNMVKSLSRPKMYVEKQVGGVIEQGYKKNSPYKYLPEINIPSNQITMKDVNHPIMAYPNGDSPQIMLPNKNYYFPNSTKVKEIPMRNYQTGGQIDQLLQMYFQAMQLTEEQVAQFMQEFQQMSPEEQQEVLAYIQQQLQDSQTQAQSQVEQTPPQEQTNLPIAQMGFEVPNSYQYGNGILDAFMCGGKAKKYQTGGRSGIQGKMIYQPQTDNDFASTPLHLRKAPIIIEPSFVSNSGETHTMQYADPVDLSAYVKTSPQQEQLRRKEVAKVRNKILNQGEDVKAVQEFLLSKGISLPKYGADGKLGNETTKALTEYAKTVNIGTDFGAISEVFAHALKEAKGIKKPTTKYEEISQASPRVEEKANKELYNWKGNNDSYPNINKNKPNVYEPYSETPLTIKTVPLESTNVNRTFPLNGGLSPKKQKLWDYVPGDDRAFMGYDVVNTNGTNYTLKAPGNRFYNYDSKNGKLTEIKGNSFIRSK